MSSRAQQPTVDSRQSTVHTQKNKTVKHLQMVAQTIGEERFDVEYIDFTCSAWPAAYNLDTLRSFTIDGGVVVNSCC